MNAETLTEKLHNRADKSLKDEIEKLILPFVTRLMYSSIPFEDRERYRATIWKARDALFAAEQDNRRDKEVSAFIGSIEDARAAIENIEDSQS